jgi:outer membrane lipopolysaccharide assembly protein LptE/RlpB
MEAMHELEKQMQKSNARSAIAKTLHDTLHSNNHDVEDSHEDTAVLENFKSQKRQVLHSQVRSTPSVTNSTFSSIGADDLVPSFIVQKMSKKTKVIGSLVDYDDDDDV